MHEGFKKVVWAHYHAHGRHGLPWRHTRDPYAILVSEMMLQQTQVQRVIPFYRAWLEKFPTLDALARAPLRDALLAWQGLGYNRRALYLKEFAEGKGMRGIGPNTAGAIAAYAYNLPTIFLETNIRRVFLHHFGVKKTDREILALVGQTLDEKRPREWYWALMDYGSSLPKIPHTRPKQKKFEGSHRQKRAAALRDMLAGSRAPRKLVLELQREGFAI